jgi:hypothetical protein
MLEGANLIQIFARAPVLGQTKRRLASELGEGAALHWYRVLLARTLATVRQLPGVTIEVWHPAEDDDYPLMELINGASVGLYPQAPVPSACCSSVQTVQFGQLACCDKP